MATVPTTPKIYHIVHVDRLASIVASSGLLCDAIMVKQQSAGTMIGISDIKARRLTSALASHKGLHVGDCVPFYFCPRSIMLYIIHCANHPNLAYRGGQQPIVHLEADFAKATAWADAQSKRWAFTLSNAGSRYFEDRADRGQLHEINWPAVLTNQWAAKAVQEGKQAEFLIEEKFPWHLIERIGVYALGTANQVGAAMATAPYRPPIEVKRDWYF